MNLNSITHIFFDLDDTLIPSSQLYPEALRDVGIDSGSPSYQSARRQVKDRLPAGHVSARNRLLYFKAMELALSPRQLLDLHDAYETALCERLRSWWASSANQRVLTDLRRRFTLAIVTNENTRTQLRKLATIDPDGILFDHVITSEEVGVEKPAQAIFLEALKVSGASSRKTIMVGDDPEKDIVASNALGMVSCLTREHVSSGGSFEADLTITSLSQLPGSLT